MAVTVRPINRLSKVLITSTHDRRPIKKEYSVEELFKEMLSQLGEDVEREGLLDTPRRAAGLINLEFGRSYMREATFSQFTRLSRKFDR